MHNSSIITSHRRCHHHHRRRESTSHSDSRHDSVHSLCSYVQQRRSGIHRQSSTPCLSTTAMSVCTPPLKFSDQRMYPLIIAMPKYPPPTLTPRMQASMSRHSMHCLYILVFVFLFPFSFKWRAKTPATRPVSRGYAVSHSC